MLLEDIRMNPTVVNDTNFDRKLSEVQQFVLQIQAKLHQLSSDYLDSSI